MTNHTPAEQFKDLEIHILPKGSKGYPVDITLDGHRFKRGYLTADILPWVSSGVPSEDGKRLFDILVTDGPLYSAWDRSRQGAPKRRIRLRIDQEATELHALPWELLQEGPTPLSASENTPFSRYLLVEAEPREQTITGQSIRMLAVISNPTDLEAKKLAPIDVEGEQKALEKVFENAPQQFSIEFSDSPVTLERLAKELRQDCHILHFIGHGAFNRVTKEHALYLQDENGQAKRVQDEKFVGMLTLQGMRPQMVFLVACQSASRSTEDAFQGLGPQLAAAGVPNVIAMQDNITIKTARKFSVEFYKRLLQHGQVDLAVNQARSTLLNTERYDAGVPVLFMRDKQNVLFQRLAGAGAKSQPAAASAGHPSLEKILAVYVHDSGKFYRTYQSKLSETLAKDFSSEELEALCDELGTEYQGRTRAAAARNLTNYCNRRSKVRFLVETIHRQRPDIAWFDQADVDPLKLQQAMSNAYDKSSLTRLGQSLSAEYGGAYYQFILYDHLQGNTVSDKIKFLIEWHRFDYPNFWDQFIKQMLRDHSHLSAQITFGSPPLVAS
jgi:hypothetical protein